MRRTREDANKYLLAGDEEEEKEADTFELAPRFLPSQKFKARTINVIKSSVLTDENYTRLAIIYGERERTIDASSASMYNRVNVRAFSSPRRRRERERENARRSYH